MNHIIIPLIILIFLPLFFSFFMSGFYTESTLRDELSEKQINEISEKFKIEIMPNEKISTVCSFGIAKSLEIYIENIESEEDFLSRFHGTIIKRDSIFEIGEYTSVYSLKLFNLYRIPKDYMCHLFFFDENGNTTARFYVVGHIPELKKIYNFSYNHLPPFLLNLTFMTCLISEFGLVILLILNNFIHRKCHD